MRVLVTGGAGYIGSITVRSLLDRGHSCVVVDTLERGFFAAVDERAEFVRGSVGDAALMEQALRGCDAVMHLAGYIEVAESQRYPDRYFRANDAEPAVMLDAMADAGVDALVFSSTAAVYGEPETVPIDEGARTSPVNSYGASKLAFEHRLDERARGGLRSVRFRYFNVAGAWPDGSIGEAHDPETHLIPRILDAMRSGRERFEIYGGDYPTPDGTCVRDYIHVADLARSHVAAARTLAAGGTLEPVYNLGSGDGVSVREIMTTMAEVTDIPFVPEEAPRRPGDPARIVASGDLAARDLDWRMRHTLTEMAASAWEARRPR